MGRPERHDADYFPFYVKDGKTLFILESKYGLQGIGFFTNLMRFLTRQTDHHICIHEESDRLYFFAQIRCPEDVGMDMLNLMAKTGKIDAELLYKNCVIVSQDLLDSLKDAYKNRNNPIIEIDQIRLSYPDKSISYQENPITSPDKPQRKLKERKLKETKGQGFVLPEWIRKETWDAFMEMRISIRAKPTEKAMDLLIAKLERLRNEGNDPNKVIEQSIENNYKGLFPLKDGGNGDGKRSNAYRTNIRGHEVPDESERINAEWRAAKAAKQAATDKAAGASNGNDAPDISDRQPG